MEGEAAADYTSDMRALVLERTFAGRDRQAILARKFWPQSTGDGSVAGPHPASAPAGARRCIGEGPTVAH